MKEKIYNDLFLLENRLSQLKSELPYYLEAKTRNSKDIETYQSFLGAQVELIKRIKNNLKELIN